MNRPLSVTLVGGFLGAGKTSLLHYFISEQAAAPAALFVECSGTSDLDARSLRGLRGAMRRSRDVILEIPGTAESARSDWFADKLAELAAGGEIGRVLVEIAGTSNAAGLAQRLRPGPEQVGVRPHLVKLDRIICVVDALDFFRGTIEPSRRGAPAPFLDFQRAQIAGASLLVLNKCDLVDKKNRDACIGLLRKFNPLASLLETAYGELPPEIWSQPDSPDLLAPAFATRVSPKITGSESEFERGELALTSIVYRARRPFHPARLWQWFEGEHPGLLRVKGLVWLATRNLLVGGVSRTRWQSSCGGAGIWWAALPREEWPEDIPSLERMQESWREPWGDRRQELNLIGDASLLPPIAQQLAGCLLTDEEFARPVADWLAFPDPFPAWDVGEGS